MEILEKLESELRHSNHRVNFAKHVLTIEKAKQQKNVFIFNDGMTDIGLFPDDENEPLTLNMIHDYECDFVEFFATEPVFDSVDLKELKSAVKFVSKAMFYDVASNENKCSFSYLKTQIQDEFKKLVESEKRQSNEN
jgi:hypothetical protein